MRLCFGLLWHRGSFDDCNVGLLHGPIHVLLVCHRLVFDGTFSRDDRRRERDGTQARQEPQDRRRNARLETYRPFAFIGQGSDKFRVRLAQDLEPRVVVTYARGYHQEGEPLKDARQEHRGTHASPPARRRSPAQGREARREHREPAEKNHEAREHPHGDCPGVQFNALQGRRRVELLVVVVICTERIIVCFISKRSGEQEKIGSFLSKFYGFAIKIGRRSDNESNDRNKGPGKIVQHE
mmetsp:Transcript_13388/g.28370  ORF Transcript_13388/g.28370 Transcript_13388/m.28370 type:complete len:239 (+) Transcript_13388:99-815(+)